MSIHPQTNPPHPPQTGDFFLELDEPHPATDRAYDANPLITDSPEPIDDQSSPRRQIAPPRRCDHTYHDYSQQYPSSFDYPVTKKSTSNFPAKLHRLISDPANSRAIQWQPHGRAWKVVDKDFLVEFVIPKYFGQTKYESFTRQLSGWGFKRLHQTGPDYRSYYHECFLRGLPHLTRMMKRVEANQGKVLPHVEAEPNFYEMDLTHPLPPHVYPPPPPPMDVNPGYPGWPAHGAPHYAGYGPPPPPNYPAPAHDPYYTTPYPHHHPYPPPAYSSREQDVHPPYQGEYQAGYADPYPYSMYPNAYDAAPQHQYPSNQASYMDHQHPHYGSEHPNSNVGNHYQEQSYPIY